MSTYDLSVPSVTADLRGEVDLRLPERRDRRGRLVTARLRRTLIGYLVVFVAGVVPLLVDASEAWRAFGLGLVAPGGGQLYAGAWIVLLVVLVLFAISLIAWFGSGMIVAPPAVWLGAAAIAGARVGDPNAWAEWAVPLAAMATLVGGSIGGRISHAAARRRGAERNRYLQMVTVAPSSAHSIELSADDLSTMRGLVDLALQPLDQFEGFDIIDQFQTSAIRYQINFSTYALSLANVHHTPAFRGYLGDAQRHFIEKMLVKRVWSYWFLENAWGNLRLDPEPIVRDNIMLSGYLGVMLAGYEAATGDRRYDEPGSLTFRWSDRKVFEHDHDSITRAVHRNFADNPWGMFPCEPNWIYSACNTFGMNTLLSHDRLHDTAYADDVLPGFLQSLHDEFLTLDGRVTAIRSSRLGLTIPSLTSTMADAGMVVFTNPIAPEFSRRLWEIIRHEFVRIDGDGLIDMDMRGWDKLDVGNYRPSNAAPFAIVRIAAAEMGDSEMVEAITRTLEERYPPRRIEGVRWYTDVSTQVNAMLAMGRYNRANGFRDLMLGGGVEDGPVLDEVPYPDCMVARATADGDRLDLVLRGETPGASVPLGFAGLRPATAYALDVDGHATTVRSDADGRAAVHARIGERSELVLAPEA